MPRVRSVVAAAVLATTLVGVAPVEAATTFRGCFRLQRHVYDWGVAKSDRAADRQEADAHVRPKVNLGVYRANKHLDRDGDGSACEVHVSAPA